MASNAGSLEKSTIPTSAVVGGRWPELDLLRTTAVVLMILNHVAVGVAVDARSLPIKSADLVGSMAPVVFFFLTGLGNGMQAARGNTGLRPDFLAKMGVLFLADALLWIQPRLWIGMDFLGFIAVSAIASKLLARSPRGWALALGLSGGLLTWRFLVHPRFHGQGAAADSCLSWICIGPPGFSYPPDPWLVYPLVGYCIGWAAGRYRPIYEARRVAVAGGLILGAVAATGLAVALQIRGAVFFRWGSVSISFFIASFAALGFAMAAATLVARGRWAKLLSIEAQQSFATVPLHFMVLAVADGVLGKAAGLDDYLVRLGAALFISFGGGWIVGNVSRSLRNSERRGAAAWWTVGAVTAGAIVWLAFVESSRWTDIGLRLGPQLGLCLLLGLPLPSQAPRRSGVSARGSGRESISATVGR